MYSRVEYNEELWEPAADRGRTHPILIAAGVAVLLFSLLGAAALTGFLPIGNTAPGESRVIAQRTPSVQPGTAAPGTAAPRRAAPSAACTTCGVIDTIQAVEVKGKTSGLGAVAGGIAGGVVGNQFGSGGAKTLLTIGGAAGGAFAGDAIEGQAKRRTAWRITVRLEDGSVRRLSQDSQPPFAVGDRVRIVNGASLERA